MRTDIIVPTYLKTDWLVQRTIECFQSVAENTSNFRIVWVDNGSSEKARNSVIDSLERRNCKIHFIFKDKPLGFIQPINLGIDFISSGNAKYVVFLNNDTIVTPHWLDNMIKYDCDITAPWTCPQDWAKQMKLKGHDVKEWAYDKDKNTLFEYAKKVQVLSRLIPVEFVPFYCVLLKREVINNLGHLDKRFGDGLFDDDQYLWGARENGYKIGIATDSYVHHFAKQTFLSIGEKHYRKLFIKNWDTFKQLHPKWMEMQRYANVEKMLKLWQN